MDCWSAALLFAHTAGSRSPKAQWMRCAHDQSGPNHAGAKEQQAGYVMGRAGVVRYGRQPCPSGMSDNCRARLRSPSCKARGCTSRHRAIDLASLVPQRRVGGGKDQVFCLERHEQPKILGCRIDLFGPQLASQPFPGRDRPEPATLKAGLANFRNRPLVCSKAIGKCLRHWEPRTGEFASIRQESPKREDAGLLVGAERTAAAPPWWHAGRNCGSTLTSPGGHDISRCIA